MLRTRVLLPLLLVSACAGGPRIGEAAATRPTVILLVRHGEKESGDDPALTPAGRARAQALAHVASGAGVSAVYSTPFRRTQQTAQPIAERLGLPVTVRDAGEKEAQAFIGALLREHAGQTVLVVGHSNTLPALAEALTGQRLVPIADDEYDRLLAVTLPAAGPASLLTLRYGAPSDVHAAESHRPGRARSDDVAAPNEVMRTGEARSASR